MRKAETLRAEARDKQFLADLMDAYLGLVKHVCSVCPRASWIPHQAASSLEAYDHGGWVWGVDSILKQIKELEDDAKANGKKDEE